MEVTSKNFTEAMPMIKASITKCDFLAIDAEFTGLRTDQKEKPSSYDYPEKFYSRVLKESTNFLLIQFGLSAFYWDDAAETYVNDTYTFFLYPRTPADKFFICHSSSLETLAANGIDFHKLVTEGIGYMTETEESIFRQNLDKNIIKYRQSYNYPMVPQKEQPLIDNIEKKVRSYLDSRESEPLILDKYNSFIENLIIQALNTSYEGTAFVDYISLKNEERLRVNKISSDQERNELINQQIDRECKKLEEAVGFSKVARMIRQSEKLVVGHNMLLDILHTLNGCFESLPNDYNKFKILAHKSFPNLIDTKYLSTFSSLEDNVNSNSLSTLLKSLTEPPFLMPKVGAIKGRGCTQTDENYHNAGFDAYITGLCFLAMSEYLQRSQEPNPRQRVDVTSYVLAPFRNKLLIAKTAQRNVPCMDLTANEKLPSRDNILYVTFPTKYKKTLYKFFTAYGYVKVEIIGEESAIIELSSKDRALQVLRNFKNQEITVMSFENYTKKK